MKTKKGRSIYKKKKMYDMPRNFIPRPVVKMNKGNIPEALKIMWELVQKNIPFELTID